MTDSKYNRFSIFTHKVKEKMGLAEKREINVTIKDESHRIDIMTDHLRKVSKHLSKMTQSFMSISESENSLNKILTDWYIAIRDDEKRTILSGSLEKVSDFVRVTEDLRKKSSEFIDEEINGKLKSILDNEFKEAKNQKNLYESVKIDLLNAQTKLASAQKSKNQEKIDACINDLEEAKNTFTKVEKETFLKLRDSLSVSEYKLIESLISYIETQKSFYDRGLRILNETMLDVYEFRKYAEKRRAIIESAPKLKRLTISKQPFTKNEKPKSVFGTPLYELNANGFCQNNVPIVVLKCIETIKKDMNEEGIFRINVSKNELEKIRKVADLGKDFDFGEHGTLMAADLLKKFLRDMPDPLLTMEHSNAFVDALKLQSESDKIKHIQTIINKLPKENICTFKCLLELLYLLSQHTKSNKMTSMALSTCIAPNILIPVAGPEVDQFELTALTITLVSFMIQNYNEIFDDSIKIPEPDENLKPEEKEEIPTTIEIPKYPEVEEEKIDFEVVTSTPREKKAKEIEKEKAPEERPPQIPTRPTPILSQKSTLPPRKINAPLPPSRQTGKKIASLPRLKKPTLTDKSQSSNNPSVIPTTNSSSPRNDLPLPKNETQVSQNDSSSPRNDVNIINNETSNNNSPNDTNDKSQNESIDKSTNESNDNSDPNQNIGPESPRLPILKPLSEQDKKK